MPRYDEKQVRTALLALLGNAGNLRATSEQVFGQDTAQPFQVPADTLRKWRDDNYADLYVELERNYGAEINSELMARMRENAFAAAAAEKLAIEELVKMIKTPAQRHNLPAAARAVADIRAKSVDKIKSMSEQPQGEVREAPLLEHIAAMQKLGYLSVNIPVPPGGNGATVPSADE